MTVTPADHRYLQVARTLRKEIVDGVFPVGSQLPTEHAGRHNAEPPGGSHSSDELAHRRQRRTPA